MATTQLDKPKKIDGFDEWEVESAAETLRRAFEIKAKPKLLAAALKVIRKRQQADRAVQGWAGNLKG